jgi:hypothetical protein
MVASGREPSISVANARQQAPAGRISRHRPPPSGEARACHIAWAICLIAFFYNLTEKKRIMHSSTEIIQFPPLGRALRVLLVWPRFAPSFWSMSGLMELVPQDTLQPPLGLVTVAALCPSHWTLRLIDRSFDALTDADILWADLVMAGVTQSKGMKGL